MVISFVTMYTHVLYCSLDPRPLGGSKVVHGIIVREEGEPGNDAIILYMLTLVGMYMCIHTFRFTRHKCNVWYYQ